VKSISYYNFAIDSLLVLPVEWSYLNTDMRKFESSQNDESRAQSADSSKVYRKPRASICCQIMALKFVNKNV